MGASCPITCCSRVWCSNTDLWCQQRGPESNGMNRETKIFGLRRALASGDRIFSAPSSARRLWPLLLAVAGAALVAASSAYANPKGGQLTANGQIVLVNPSAITFSKSAVVDVNSIVATPTNISNHNSMAGNMRFHG